MPSLPSLLLMGVALMVAAPFSLAAEQPRRGIAPFQLKCEYQTQPLAVVAERPRLSWKVEGAAGVRGQSQSAYQVRVASSAERLRRGRADLWDSGRVASTETLGVEYGGRLLRAGERAHWQVRVWDQDGRPSAYSEASWWEAGLRPTDWRATWIRSPRPGPGTEREMFGDDPAPLFRKEIRLSKAVRRARAHVTGLGYYELRLNGRKVSDAALDPGWTRYDKRVYYSTFDVTELLQRGPNALAAMVGNGWWNPLPLRLFNRINLRQELPIGRPRFLLQLEIEYRDGSRETVVTDPSWKTAPGPVVRNSVYLGEVYDAGKEQPGWDRAGFDDGAWANAVPAEEKVGVLEPQLCPPIKPLGEIRAVKRTEPKPGVFIFDLGQNFAGWATLRARGPAGTRVQMRFGELLYPDGTLNPMTSVTTQIKNSRVSQGIGGPATAWQSDTYILRGEGEEVYTPRFTYHGFRYVEVTGYPGTPPVEAVSGIPLCADVPEASTLETDDRMLTDLTTVCRRTFRSNLFSVQSDCPHREKFGYGGDIVATSDALMLNFDMARFYAKAVQDLADSARPNGGLTETAPYVGIADEGLGGGAGPIGWGTAGPLLMWQLYEYYGDRRILAEHYETARRWMELLKSTAKDGILDNGISDHESLVPKPRALTGTAFYYYNARLLERIARVLGKGAEAEGYGRLAGEIREALNRRFLQPETGKYDTGTQAAQAFPLFMDLVPGSHRQKALDTLLADIAARDGHLSTGIFGTKYMLRALSELGRPDAASALVHQRSFPSWGHMLEGGATTLWETWKFSDNVYSHNHPMFGSVSEWIYRTAAGINPDPEMSGWKRVILKPYMPKEAQWLKASYDSVRGRVTSHWRRTGQGVEWEVSVPANTTALVSVPAASRARITEGGLAVDQAPGVRFVRSEGGTSVFEVGSGVYRFAWPL